MRIKYFLITIMISACTMAVQAQRSIRFTEPNYMLREAIQLVDIHYYQQAHIILTNYLTTFRQDDRWSGSFDQQQALFYFHLCGLKLNRQHADEALEDFIDRTPFYSLQQLGHYQLGRHYYEKQHFEAAIRHYELSGLDVLSNKQLAQRNFELGYSYLVTQQLDKVEPYFQSAKNIPGEYAKPGSYYHGLLAYYKRNYTQAKADFTAVKDDDRYKKIIPFYLTEIDYLSGNKEQALQKALSYLKSPGRLYFEQETNQMLAQIYFEKKDFGNAETYYRTVIGAFSPARPEDYFKLAYCQYEQGKVEAAIPNLQEAIKTEGSIRDHAMYLLAICYLKAGDKLQAYETLKNCGAMPDSIRQRAVDFNLAKLSYENGDDQSSLQRLKTFIRKFPDTGEANEANELLAYLHIKYQFFDDAVIAMNKIRNISPNLKKVYQKTNYARGIQLLLDDNPDKAIFHFVETKKFPEDETIVSLAGFWLAECNYRLGRYSEAMQATDYFFNHADTASMQEYTRKLHLTRAYIFHHADDTSGFFNEYAIATGDTNRNDLLARISTVKTNFIPEKIPVVDNDPYILVYELPEEKMDFSYKPVPIKPLALSQEIVREDQTNYIGLGLGNLSTIGLSAGYNADNLVNYPLYVDFNYQSTRGKLEQQHVNAMHLGMYSNAQVKAHAVDFSLNIDRNRQFYYGYDRALFNYSQENLRQIYQNTGISAFVRPLKENKSDIKYAANMYTGLYNDQRGSAEYAVRAEINASKEFRSDLQLQSDLLADANLFFTRNLPSQSNSLIAWRPAVIKQFDKFSIKTGLYPTLGKRFHLLPDLQVNYPMESLKLTIQLAWNSRLMLNTYRQLSSLNPFMINEYTIKQTTVNEWTAAISGNLLQGVSYAVRSGLALYNNLPLFLNDTSSDGKKFVTLFDKRVNTFLLDASLDYSLSNEWYAGLKLNMRPVVQQTTYAEAWHYLPSMLTLYGKLRATKDILISMDVFIPAGVKAIAKSSVISGPYTKILYGTMDMNVSLRYMINRKWNARIDLNNLFGSDYQRWNQYPIYGTNASVALLYSFRSLRLVD